MNLPLFDHKPYPKAPGYRDNDTSKAAAEAIAPSAANMRDRVLAALTRPMTDWELADAVGLPFDSVQPRRSELLADGYVKFSDEYGISGRSNKRVKRWVRV